MYDTEKTEKLLHFIRSELDRILDRSGGTRMRNYRFSSVFFQDELFCGERESHGKCCIVCSRIGWRFSADRIIYHKTASIRQKAAAACVYTVFVCTVVTAIIACKMIRSWSTVSSNSICERSLTQFLTARWIGGLFFWLTLQLFLLPKL